MGETKGKLKSEGGIAAKRTAKDSVFTDLFKHRRYLVELYEALHPEDKGITEEAITNVTVSNVLTDKIYNDLGFTVSGRQIILVEAQSTWTVNILIRLLLYIARTYQEYIARYKLDVYSSKRIEIPQPELYMIFTGRRKARKDILSLSEEFFDGLESALEVKVRVIYDGVGEDIISQYIAFTRIFDEQVRAFGATRKAVAETIRACKNRNILKEYLESREQEVGDIMYTLFDEEMIMENFIASERREAAKKAAKKAEQETLKATVFRMSDLGFSEDVIASAVQVNPDIIAEWLKNRTLGG